MKGVQKMNDISESVVDKLNEIGCTSFQYDAKQIADRIEYLVTYLNERTEEFDAGHPTISDEAWDTLYFELKDLEQCTGIVKENSPTQSIHYCQVNELEKAEHNHKMLSLDKTKEIDEVVAFLGGKRFLAMCKMDGLTCSLRYVDGKLVSAETRGNGQIGENILHNALVIPSIPKRIPIKEELIVDGEIICALNDFQEFADEYKNSRNFAAGSIRLLDSRECERRKLTFVVWDVIKGLEFMPLLSSKFEFLHDECYFITVPGMVGDTEKHINDAIEYVKKVADHFSYPIDGVVFKFDDVQFGRAQGETSHHFKNAIAFKFYDETYPSTLRLIEWTMGRTGVLTPVALFEPIDIDGSTVERASLHNVNIMEETLGKPFIGQEVQVYKANMIIPQIASAEMENPDNNMYLGLPTVCPVCGGEVKLVTSAEGTKNMICLNPACEGKLINKLDHFCGKKGLDIKGLSKATLEKLIDWGWIESPRDLFTLHTHSSEWAKKPGFGPKSVNNICDAIANSMANCELWQFISAIGIPLMGSTYAKEIAKKMDSWLDFREAVESRYDFSNWDGFGVEMTNSLLKFDYEEADYIYENYVDVVNNMNTADNNEQATLDGITVVITGKLNQFKNRDALKDKIEAAGGKVVGSVSKNTTYLINNDATSTSSKNLTAQKLGVTIITEEEFMKKFFD